MQLQGNCFLLTNKKMKDRAAVNGNGIGAYPSLADMSHLNFYSYSVIMKLFAFFHTICQVLDR